MAIEVNGKKYGFNSDVRLGVLELAENIDNIKMKHIKLILREILIPTPTNKELFNIRKSQLLEIMKKYGNFMEKESTEIKKKLSG